MKRAPTIALVATMVLLFASKAHKSWAQATYLPGQRIPAARRQSSPPPAVQEMLTMNFQDVDIGVLAKFISEITGKNIVLDESVRGKVSIISPTKVTPAQAYNIFQSVLQLKGFTTVQAGPVVKIVPLRSARESAAMTHAPAPGQSQGDAYVTRLVKLRHVEVAALVGVIQPLISREGLVAAFPQTNTLILTDNAFNIDRLLSVIQSLDVQGQQQDLEVIPLKLAYATDLAPEIEKIMGEKDSRNGAAAMTRAIPGMAGASAVGPSQAFKIIPDERTNSLIVTAGPLQMAEIKSIVRKLDIHAPLATSRIHVYHLKYASALQLLDVLNGLLGGSSPGQPSPQTGRGALGRMGGGAMGGMGGMGGMSSMNGMGGMGGMGSSGFGGSFGGGGMGMTGMSMGFGGGMGVNNAGAASASTPNDSKHKGPAEFESQVRVTADPTTNALVITAGPQDYETLSHVIQELDVPRRQVFVQAVIAEVSVNLQTSLGVSMQNLGGAMGGFSVGQLNYGTMAQSLANPASANGMTMGLISGANCSVAANALTGIASMAAMGMAGAATGGLGALTGMGGYGYGGYGGYGYGASPYGYGYGVSPYGISPYGGYGYGGYGYPMYGNGTNGTIPMPCDIAMITALEQDSQSDIISAPTILTADNEEATIVVGQNLPFLSSASMNAGMPGAMFSGVDRQNVGIMLDIVPQISDGGFVKLDIYEEVSNVVNGTTNNTLGPTTTIRSASTSVSVENHHTAVIGGLLSNELDKTNTGVPSLSNLPILGNLFSQKSTTKTKTNLLVFLTPHIILTNQDLKELSLDERRKFIAAMTKQEAKDMPRTQARILSQPGFSRAVTPGQELQGTVQSLPGFPTDKPVLAPEPAQLMTNPQSGSNH
jgi:general secretion pathway protein D